MVPLSNLITALAVVRNRVPRMKASFHLPLCPKSQSLRGQELGASTTYSFSGSLIGLFSAPFLTPFFVSASFTDTSISGLSVSLLSSSVAPSYMLFFSSSSLIREMEFTLLVTGDLASSLISTFSKVLLVGLDLYVHEKRRGSALAAYFGFADEISNRLLRHKLEGCVLSSVLALVMIPLVRTLMVVEGKVLNDFPRFIGIIIVEFAADGVVNFALKMKGYMIIKNLDLKPTIDDIIPEFCGPSWWKELIKETSSKIIPCGAFFPCFHRQVQVSPQVLGNPRGVGFDPQTGVHEMSIRFAPTGWCRIKEVPHCSLRGDNGILVALVARFGVVSKSTDMILGSHGG
uniref:Uncharacterized protein n=1 Tax=Tanacetum cinerariifolium TaxID=118510 RepID=A0A6L2J3Y9_TANCI|nr:hypothetical protein [Tanacetum cinerariifolium]